MKVPEIKLAYAIDGTPLSPDAETPTVRITIRGGKVEAECKGLPNLQYQYYGGRRVLTYLPRAIEERIHADLTQSQVPNQKDIEVLLFMFHLPPSEKSAHSKAGLSEWWYKGMPPASDGKLLSTRMSF